MATLDQRTPGNTHRYAASERQQDRGTGILLVLAAVVALATAYFVWDYYVGRNDAPPLVTSDGPAVSITPMTTDDTQPTQVPVSE